ncbi:cytochrome d ubiquinol oxidase subunit II [Paraburkholderia phenoliruptrix]|uniref:Cytochrome d ubiquinol oxidase subunit II n=2 Tax=Paraburkholderia phenoliruptrix TaxID=252970 RepID=K0DTL5_9BURK|nr:cytochrome d ubiquinol oxidase subunit II [Paraburkholderia phenoliruptrix]AFT89581.1 cytochrome d ubiquinol oxidase subunit II [Paraburkholderia phenoliruptrix BR3459a]MDR6422671.1 cytochrome d ubiquinol oxidase subunit II [Paraburkholderia phenoliruptrix]CAB4051496.1 Cytochrome bd-I ubiquinol oxidase subunit 2 [Paraburkholderia phenoliruptrix]
MDVTVVWAAIIALGLFMYVVLDGFDLGIGIVFPFFPDEKERDLMMNTVAPVWDGNETWLVLGGAALFAVFPTVYSTVLSALYLPLIFMLVCLIFRGVSFEIRAKANRTKHLWDLAFIGGSAGAAFFQGVALGAFLQGIPVIDGAYAGDAFGWLTPFSLLSGLGLVVTYALLGCCWLVAKTEGDLQRRLHRVVWPLTVVLLGFIATVSLWTPLQDANIAQRWFDDGLFYRLLPVPFLVAGCAFFMRRAVRERHHNTPFALALLLVLLGYAGLLVSLWPYAIPSSVTLWEAAAPRASQTFTLVGAAVILPIIIAYTTMGYWVFRGKVRHGDQHHYH